MLAIDPSLPLGFFVYTNNLQPSQIIVYVKHHEITRATGVEVGDKNKDPAETALGAK